MTVPRHPWPRSPAAKMRIEEFESVARAAAREDVALEYLSSRIQIRTAPDSNHNAILMWLMRQCVKGSRS